MIAGSIIGVYFWSIFGPIVVVGQSLIIPDVTVIAAAIVAVISFAFYFVIPKKSVWIASLAVYVSLLAMVGLLVYETGQTASPFIALWMLVSVFAGVLGIYGIGAALGFLAVFAGLSYGSGSLSEGSFFTLFFAGILPLVASFIIWHRQRDQRENSKDRAYRDLANELSQVAGKSEVVINAIADGVVAVDNQGIIQLINPAAQRITGWTKQDAMSLNFESILKLVDGKGEQLSEIDNPVKKVLADNQEVHRNDLTLITNSAKKILVSLVVSPVGQIGSGAIIVFNDITAEKAEERQQAEFISTASHEMRTPVASIEGYLGLALNPATATIDDKAREFITKAHESAQHLGRLFQDLLDVSKADDGRLSNNPKVVDLTAFAHDIVEGLRPKAEDKGLRLFYRPQPGDEPAGERTISPVFYVNVDNDHLREIVANLVENAIKYTLKGDVVVDITGDNDHATISIADSGIGIPREDMPHLFQKFYRVDNSDTREIGGTGLGLYLCRRLTETIGGRIWAESEYKKGSTFYVELPRIDHEEAMRLIDAATERAAAEEQRIIMDGGQPPATSEPFAPEPTTTVLEPAVEIGPATDTAATPSATPIPVTYQSETPAAPTETPPVVEQAPPVQPPMPEQAPANIPLSVVEQNPAQYTQQGRLAASLRPQAQPLSIPERDSPSQ